MKILSFSPNLETLVLRCIDSYDSESRLILQHFSRTTRSTILCTAQISKFQEKSPDFFAKMKFSFSFSFSFSFLLNSMNFVIFLLNFDEFLSEFHEQLQRITDILGIFIKLPEKFGKMLEISGFCEEFHSSVSLFSIASLLHVRCTATMKNAKQRITTKSSGVSMILL